MVGGRISLAGGSDGAIAGVVVGFVLLVQLAMVLARAAVTQGGIDQLQIVVGGDVFGSRAKVRWNQFDGFFRAVVDVRRRWHVPAGVRPRSIECLSQQVDDFVVLAEVKTTVDSLLAWAAAGPLRKFASASASRPCWRLTRPLSQARVHSGAGGSVTRAARRTASVASSSRPSM